MTAYSAPGVNLRLYIKFTKNIEEVCQCVAEYYEIPLTAMLLRSRKFRIVEARCVAFYILYYHRKEKLVNIGAYFNIDHSTVVHGRNRIKNLTSVGDRVKGEIENILELIDQKRKLVMVQRNIQPVQ